ncbi:MAG: hypothetical protein KF764_01865 [Labilithrix sp.]|nr:hypothetical protein [Labilithrix sp.]
MTTSANGDVPILSTFFDSEDLSMTTIDELLGTLEGTKIHALVKDFGGAAKPITHTELNDLWLELDARSAVRRSIRQLAQIAHPANDTSRGRRLPQVLLALAVLSKKSQVVLVVGDEPQWEIYSPIVAHICLDKTMCDKNPKRRKTLPDANGRTHCCGKSNRDIRPDAAWHTELSKFAAQERAMLGLLSPSARTYFFNNGKMLDLCFLSR